MRVSILAAVARNRVIGRGNDLPWRLPEDLRRFKRLTMGHTIVMGRRTFESIGRPLPGRTSVVLTRRGIAVPDGVRVAGSLEEALGGAGGEEVFVVGGGEIYGLALPRANRLYLTHVEADVEGDTVFPPVDPSDWARVEEEGHAPDEKHAHPFRFVVYDRVRR